MHKLKKKVAVIYSNGSIGVATVRAFAASDEGNAITETILNLTAGMVF